MAFTFKLPTPEERAAETAFEKACALELGQHALRAAGIKDEEFLPHQSETEFDYKWNLRVKGPKSTLHINFESGSTTRCSLKHNRKFASCQGRITTTDNTTGQGDGFPLGRDYSIYVELTPDNIESAIRTLTAAISATKQGKTYEEVQNAAKKALYILLDVPFAQKDKVKSLYPDTVWLGGTTKKWAYVGEKLPQKLEQFLPKKGLEPAM
jgi:hypothetical protein